MTLKLTLPGQWIFLQGKTAHFKCRKIVPWYNLSYIRKKRNVVASCPTSPFPLSPELDLKVFLLKKKKSKTTVTTMLPNNSITIGLYEREKNKNTKHPTAFELSLFFLTSLFYMYYPNLLYQENYFL